MVGVMNRMPARGTADVEGAVKIHYLVLRASGGNGFLDLGPLSDEISKRL